MNRCFFCMAGLFVTMLASVLPSRGQVTYLGTGQVSVLKTSADCTGRGFSNPALCQLANVTGCGGDESLEFLFAINPPVGQSKGTIVLLSGFGGTNATEAPDQGNSFVSAYTSRGYTVLQVAWGGETQNGGIDWEFTHADPTMQPSVRNAACRPASLLLWAYNNSLIYTGGGKCVQGFSAGAGAAAASVSWYGAADPITGYLDKMLLISGPELADIKQGCEIDSSGANNQSTNICLPGQLGCSGWLPNTRPAYRLEFSPSAASQVEHWSGGTMVTGPATCGNNRGNPTDPNQNQRWADMSIVELPAQNGLPNFNFPNTALSAFLCQTVASGVAPNNSESQGELFYLNFTSASQLLLNAYKVFAVTGCPSAEDVNGGTDVTSGLAGFDAIVNDMTIGLTACKKNR